MCVPELLLLPKIIRIFGPKTAIFAPKYAFFGTYIGLASSFGALLVGWFLVLVHGLYLARHLFTLYAITTYAYPKPHPRTIFQKWNDNMGAAHSKHNVKLSTKIPPPLQLEMLSKISWIDNSDLSTLLVEFFKLFINSGQTAGLRDLRKENRARLDLAKAPS